MKLYLVRHGQSEANVGKGVVGTKAILTKVGVEQARRIGMHFENKKIDKIYCSKLTRAKNTLKEIRPYLKKTPLTFTKEINEQYRGIYDADREGYKKALKASGQVGHEFRPPNGENLYDLEERAQKFLDFLKKRHTKDNVLVVGHGMFFRFLILRIFKLHMREGSYFELHNAGVSSFVFDKNFKVKDFEIDDYAALIKHSSYVRPVVEKGTRFT